MADLRLNGAIRALEAGRPAFTCFQPAEIDSAYAIQSTKFDGVVWEMEHNPWDGKALRDALLEHEELVGSEITDVLEAAAAAPRVVDLTDGPRAAEAWQRPLL